MKPFAFIPPNDENAIQKNQQVLDLNTKFNVWSPTITNTSNCATKAYYSLTGPLCFYWIQLKWSGGGGNMTLNSGGTTSVITNPPFGPNSLSGQKATYDPMFLNAVKDNGVDMITGYYASLGYAAGLPTISLPNTGAFTTGGAVYIYGTFFRD